MLHPKNQPVLSSSSEHLVHAGNESRDSLLTVAEVTTLNVVEEPNRD
jgi:hypothetical protein